MAQRILNLQLERLGSDWPLTLSSSPFDNVPSKS